MPKELIYGTEPPGSSTPELHVRVGWSDQSVQVAAINPHSDLPPRSSDPTMSADVNGWFISLDRRGINDLIRVLRRARDRAYGSDE